MSERGLENNNFNNLSKNGQCTAWTQNAKHQSLVAVNQLFSTKLKPGCSVGPQSSTYCQTKMSYRQTKRAKKWWYRRQKYRHTFGIEVVVKSIEAYQTIMSCDEFCNLIQIVVYRQYRQALGVHAVYYVGCQCRCHSVCEIGWQDILQLFTWFMWSVLRAAECSERYRWMKQLKKISCFSTTTTTTTLRLLRIHWVGGWSPIAQCRAAPHFCQPSEG